MNKIGGICFAHQQAGTVHKIYLYDEVKAKGDFNWETWEYDESETSASHFRDLLEGVSDSDTIELYINSDGGSVKEGTAIYKPETLQSIQDGLCGRSGEQYCRHNSPGMRSPRDGGGNCHASPQHVDGSRRECG